MSSDAHGAAVEVFSDVLGRAEKGERDWQRMAVGLALVILIETIAFWKVAMRSTTVPYIVQVDEHAYAIAVGPADETSVTSDRVVRAFLARFIADHRSYVRDEKAQAAAVGRVFNALAEGSEADRAAREFYQAVLEREYGEDEGFYSRVRHVLHRGGNSWQVDFVEEHWSGKMRETRQFVALLDVEFEQDRKEARVLLNPLGIYVVRMRVQEEQQL